MQKTNQFYNFNMDDMNVEVSRPNFFVHDKRIRGVAHSNRNIWDTSYQTNQDWTGMDSRRSVNQVRINILFNILVLFPTLFSRNKPLCM